MPVTFTRKALKALGLSDEQSDSVIELHTVVTDALKAQNKDLEEKINSMVGKEEVEKLQKELENSNELKSKYEKVDKEFKEFKATVESEKKKAIQDKAFNEWVKKLGFSQKGRDIIMEFYKERPDFDEKGNIIDTDKKIETALKTKFDDYMQTEKTEGIETSNPPANNGSRSGISRAREIANQYHASQWGGAETKGES